MKIREYIEETTQLVQKFDAVLPGANRGNELELLRLFDAIENREGDVFMWHSRGLTDDDEVPEPATRVLTPSFKPKEM